MELKYDAIELKFIYIKYRYKNYRMYYFLIILNTRYHIAKMYRQNI